MPPASGMPIGLVRYSPGDLGGSREARSRPNAAWEVEMGGQAAVSRAPDQLDVFRVGADGRVTTSWWHAGNNWASWRPIGGFFPPGAPVSAVARTGNNLDLFVVGNDGRVYTSWWYA